MAEQDMFAYMLKKHGEPEHARLVPWEEAKRYAGRLPDALLDFWMQHGRGSYRDGFWWICDPAPFKPVIDTVFAGDPEFDSREMLVVCHDAFGELNIWHPVHKDISIHFPDMTMFCPPEKSFRNSRTGEWFGDNFNIGNTVLMGFQFEGLRGEDGEDLFSMARQKLGPLSEGEIYGFVPALVLGGERRVENLRKVKAAEHLGMLAQLDRLTVTQLTPPEPPMFPYGRVEPVRKLGPRGQSN